jgi:hypothetical protein
MRNTLAYYGEDLILPVESIIVKSPAFSFDNSFNGDNILSFKKEQTLSVCLSIYLSACLFVCLSLFMSVCLWERLDFSDTLSQNAFPLSNTFSNIVSL